jgi:hypothetical protein
MALVVVQWTTESGSWRVDSTLFDARASHDPL